MKSFGVIGLRIEQLAADLAGGPQPLLPSTGLLVEPCIFDCNASCRGQGQDELLVLSGERLTVDAVCQIEVSEHGISAADGNAEEGGHRWMAVREARRPRIVRNPGQPDRLGIFDECTEHAASL